MKFPSLVFVLGLSLLTTNFAHAGEGGNSSGGGFLCYTPSGVSLLDLVDAGNGAIPEDSTVGADRITFGKIGQTLGYEKRNLQDLSVYAKVKQRIELWRKSSPTLIGLLSDAIDNNPLRFSGFDVPMSGETYVAKDATRAACAQIKPAALFTPQLDVVISQSAWNKMGTESQVGLAIHEGLRHVQLIYQAGLKTGDIEKLTAEIVMHDPSGSDTLDSAEYFQGDLLAEAMSSQAYAKNYSSAVQKVCDGMKPMLAWSETEIVTNVTAFIAQNCTDAAIANPTQDPDKMINQIEPSFWATADVSHLDLIQAQMDALDPVADQFFRQAIQNNDHKFVDGIQGLDRVSLNIGEQAMFDYISGTSAHSFMGLSSEDRHIKQAIKTVHDGLQTASARGSL